jgi:elongation factor 3
MTQCCSAVDNKDIYEAIPKVIHAVCDIKEVPETIHTLGAVVFVQTVEGPVLALLVPLLVRASLIFLCNPSPLQTRN